MAIHAGKMIGGAALVAEGAALMLYGMRYLDFMQRNGMMDLSKRMLRTMGIRSKKTLAVIGLTEAAIGLVLLNRARQQRPATA
jgi:hypothetical protein